MKSIAIIIFVLFTLNGFSQSEKKRTSEFNLEKKVAIQGYDPFTYFKQSNAIKGKEELSAVYEGVTYYFSSLENRETFLKRPSAYEPQYGGWCAFAMGDSGEKVAVNPNTFKIIEGKLYLFYNAYFTNTLKSWNKDQTKLKSKADRNWEKFIQ
jgi:YHS domain-containing protein